MSMGVSRDEALRAPARGRHPQRLVFAYGPENSPFTAAHGPGECRVYPERKGKVPRRWRRPRRRARGLDGRRSSTQCQDGKH